jgi:hypothetical protein
MESLIAPSAAFLYRSYFPDTACRRFLPACA